MNTVSDEIKVDEGYDIYLSYSGRYSYLTCPKQYQYRYIDRDPTRSDPSGSFFGSAIGMVFEWFYRSRLWSTPDPVFECISLIPEAIRDTFKDKDFVPPNSSSIVYELEQDLKKYIPIAIQIIKKYGLLTTNSQAEVDLRSNYYSNQYGFTIQLSGRADFIHTHENGDIWLLDGKGSSHRDKFVDSEQLIWYATQHYLKYHVAPSRLGFLFYKFPDDPISWVHYTSEDIRSSLRLTFDVASKIRLKVFNPTPSDECNRCDYKNKCEEGIRYISERRASDKIIVSDSVFDLEYV